jgi:hypothetical protein
LRLCIIGFTFQELIEYGVEVVIMSEDLLPVVESLLADGHPKLLQETILQFKKS